MFICYICKKLIEEYVTDFRIFESIATWLGKGLIYLWTVLLCQWPSSCIGASEILDNDADVAAPIL